MDAEFLDTITRARARVELNLEERMYDGVGSPRGSEFGLKNNFDWKDKHDVKHEGGINLVYVDKDLKDI